MLNKIWVCTCLAMILPGLLLTTACSKRAVQTGQMAEQTAPAVEENTAEHTETAAVDSQAAEEVDTAQPAARETETQTVNMVSRDVMNEDIYFEFDSSVLKDAAKDDLIRKAEWLRVNPGSTVIIEGHCDERGTSAYNIALGDRRAQSAKAFFVDMGIDADQLSTISYGEERPVDIAKTETAWAKNRRAHFVVD